MSHLQSALFAYSDGPSEIVPENVPVDGWHRQPPEHVTVTVGVRVVHPALQVQFVKAALPAGELEFDGQALHVELAEAPTAV